LEPSSRSTPARVFISSLLSPVRQPYRPPDGRAPRLRARPAARRAGAGGRGHL